MLLKLYVLSYLSHAILTFDHRLWCRWEVDRGISYLVVETRRPLLLGELQPLLADLQQS